MQRTNSVSAKIAVLGGVIALTLGIHYGWLIDPIFGHVHWIHAIHGRFCYIPIVIAAAWFGLRGGLLTATLITVLITPYLLRGVDNPHDMAGELADVVFYFALAALSGALFDRELRSRRRAEEMRVQLERSQRLSLLGRVAAGLAHEIKNPLASIKGAVEILSDDNTAESEREEFRQIVHKEIQRINNRVMELLEIARPREMQTRPVDLVPLVEACIRQVQAQTSGQPMDIEGKLPQERVVVRGDDEKLHQVLLNVLLNAVEASPEEGRVTVALAVDDRSNEAVLTVDDDGPGIDPAEIDKVFEPFHSTKASGTGLGLAIARAIVEQHGGAITLENRKEGGLRVSIRLPLSGSED